jgi:CheY-like chemotaxis protein
MDKATILVVDDDSLVRSVLRDVLQAHGHLVLEARFTSEALVLLRQYENTIHLMIADVMMPGINGRELAQMLAPSRPNMKVMYVSGYPEEIVKEKLRPPEMKAFLQKPFGPETLLRKIQDILHAPSGGGRYAVVSGLPCELTESQLGMLYEIGVPTDYVEAYKWYLLALATDDDDRVLVRINNLKSRMTPEQIGRAEQSARILTESRRPATRLQTV